MEHFKISKLLNDSTVLKFVAREWIEVNDLSGDQYSIDKNIRFESMIKSDLCHYSDSYIFLKGSINVRTVPNTKINQKGAAFKNNAPLRSVITKINNTQ